MGINEVKPWNDMEVPEAGEPLETSQFFVPLPWSSSASYGKMQDSYEKWFKVLNVSNSNEMGLQVLLSK